MKYNTLVMKLLLDNILDIQSECDDEFSSTIGWENMKFLLKQDVIWKNDFFIEALTLACMFGDSKLSNYRSNMVLT